MKKLISLMLVTLLAVIFTTSAWAASIQISATVRTAFNKTAAAADSQLQSKLNTQFNDFASSQEQDRDWDKRTKALHSRNLQGEKEIRSLIKYIDAAIISKLEADVKEAKARYKPLLDIYKVLGSRSGDLRTPVQLAKLAIKAKESALKEAKDKARNKAAAIRKTLAEADPIEKHIKTQRSAIKSPSDRLFAEWKTFSQAVKKLDAEKASSSLTYLNSQARQIAEWKSSIYSFEVQINDILLKAKAQMP